MKSRREAPLRVVIDRGQITISIGVETLAFAVEHGGPMERLVDRGLNEGNFVNPKVTSADTFACEVVRELEREEEDGTTPVHSLLDDVCMKAIDNGADGVELPEDYNV